MADVVVTPESFRRSGRGSITGVMYIRGPAGDFPETGWNDFPIVILGWWLQSVAHVLAGRSPQAVLEFMDGPFQVRVRHRADGTLAVEGERRGHGQQVIAIAARDDFARSLACAANLAASECARRGWETDDTEALSQAILAFDRVARWTPR